MICRDRLFAGSSHMVWNKLHWDANNAVGLPKQRNSYQSSPTFLCFDSPTASFASQYNLFRTMWLDPTKGLLYPFGKLKNQAMVTKQDLCISKGSWHNFQWECQFFLYEIPSGGWTIESHVINTTISSDKSSNLLTTVTVPSNAINYNDWDLWALSVMGTTDYYWYYHSSIPTLGTVFSAFWVEKH